jgi:ribosomal protein S18 acetylase RimI-like enzyme
MSFRIRGFTDKDLAHLVRLVNAARREAYQFVPYTEEGLSLAIKEANLQILMAEEEGRLVGTVAYNDGHWGEEIEWLYVDDVANRKALENALVTEIEKCIKKGSVFTVVDAGSPKIEEWTEIGYGLQNGLYHMVAPLDSLKTVPKVSEDVVLRSLRMNEEKEFVEAVNAGFGSERVTIRDIERWKTESPPFNEEWVQVAEINGKIISVVVAKPDTFYNTSFKKNRGYLGPATTLPEHRGKSLASALTLRAMNLLFEKGMDSVALYTAEQNLPSVALLKRIGFDIGHHWQFMRKTLPKKE